ncbi:NUDIX domain-containing protein [Massilia sp. MS-15]|uniref:NUDIX hydrolase n=1 Tax=Massilia sp. MS-15 TaxID=2878200 RepID=UPI001CD61CC9|nr:NUDIX hydrolase [Massilia sp. MS-15]MCA1248848.1 NUDIX hydrolase [Massilia sp. MS-15]
MFTVSIKGVLATASGGIVLLMNERKEWELPGGRIEAGETPQECVRREIHEELGLSVSVEDLLDAYLFEVIPGKHVFIVSYACTLEGRFDPRISHEHQRFGVFQPDALPPNLPDGYRSTITRWQLRRSPEQSLRLVPSPANT